MIPMRIRVEEMGGNVQAGVAEWQLAVVEIKQIGMIFVEQVLGAVEPLGHISLIRLRADGMVLGIQILRVEAVPPQTPAVGLGQLAVVGHASQRPGFIAALRVFIPAPSPRAMNTHTEGQPGFTGEPGPSANDVLFRPHPDRIPRLIFRIEHVHVVVVVGHRDKKSGPGALVTFDERGRIPLVRLPFMDDIFESKLRGMPIMCDVEIILRPALVIHVFGIPVALPGLALRTPMCPDAELRVAIPVGQMIILLQRFPARLKRAGRDGVTGRDARRCGGCQRARQPERRAHTGAGGQRGCLEKITAGKWSFHVDDLWSDCLPEFWAT